MRPRRPRRAPWAGAVSRIDHPGHALTYAVRLLDEPDSFTDADIDELHAHGWSDRILADVVGLVALNQLTGSFNLIAGLEPVPATPAA